jgi:hypothetical protein
VYPVLATWLVVEALDIAATPPTSAPAAAMAAAVVASSLLTGMLRTFLVASHGAERPMKASHCPAPLSGPVPAHVTNL